MNRFCIFKKFFNLTKVLILLLIFSTCYCSNTYGAYGLSASDLDCNIVCSVGKNNEKCGGTLKNSIYEVKSKPFNIKAI